MQGLKDPQANLYEGLTGTKHPGLFVARDNVIRDRKSKAYTMPGINPFFYRKGLRRPRQL
jgi:hypothetical protein